MRAKSADSARRASTRGNFVQACVTTAHGRMLLYKQLELLGDRVLYYDTDSIFYRSEEGDIDPPKGDFLGQFTDVFSGDCRQFVALGPKNYAYLAGEKPTVKVRGLTFNKTSSAIVNLAKMQTIAEDSIAIHRSGNSERLATLDGASGFVARRENVPRFTIVSGVPSDPLYMAPKIVNKCYKVVFDKRVIDWGGERLLTYPYGYCGV